MAWRIRRRQRKGAQGAVDEQRALLDRLMGKQRDELEPDEKPEISWDDEDVCPHFLCGFCPCDLFTNTRADLGVCDRVHKDELKEKFDLEDRATKRKVEKRMLYKLHHLISEIDQKINRGRKRIEQDKGAMDEMKEKRLRDLDSKMEDLLGQMEALGDEGKVEEAQEMLRKVEELQKQKDAVTTGEAVDAVDGAFGRRGVMGSGVREPSEFTVCNVCGVFVSVHERPQDSITHLEGKQHRGYQMIRDKIDELEKLHEQDREERRKKDKDKESSRRRRRRSRSKSRSKRSKSAEDKDKKAEGDGGEAGEDKTAEGAASPKGDGSMDVEAKGEEGVKEEKSVKNDAVQNGKGSSERSSRRDRSRDRESRRRRSRYNSRSRSRRRDRSRSRSGRSSRRRDRSSRRRR